MPTRSMTWQQGLSEQEEFSLQMTNAAIPAQNTLFISRPGKRPNKVIVDVDNKEYCHYSSFIEKYSA